MCKSFVSIPWPSTLYCLNRGVFSSAKHIGVEYTRAKCQWTLFLLSTLVWIALIFYAAKQFYGTFRTDRVSPDGLPWPHVMANCVNFFNLNSNITITTIPHSMPRSTAADEHTESAKTSQMLLFCTLALSGSYDVWGGTHATNPLKTKDNLQHIHFLSHRDAWE